MRSGSGRLTRRRTALLALALLSISAATFSGYLFRATGAPEARDADSRQAGPSGAVSAEVDLGALTEQRSRGLDAGAGLGARRGRARGARRGRAAGAAAVRKEAEAIAAVRGDGPGHGESDPRSTIPGNVLVVGDSLEVSTSQYLQRYLPSVELTVSAEIGYSSPQIFGLFEQSYDPSHAVIVFDAGTNDDPAYPQLLASRLQAVAEPVGSRCMVVPTIHAPLVNGVSPAGKNRVVRAFAASRPGTQVPDWAGAVASHPEWMKPDNLHPTPEGANLRARLIARGIRSCLAFG